MADLLLSSPPARDLAALPSTPTERRLRREWDLLNVLVQLNPARLSGPTAFDSTFQVLLSGTPALPLSEGSPALLTEHRLRLHYPRFFPAVPLELYLDRPVLHPNIHPVSGFVCLWRVHRVEYGVEHALHRTVAILGWQLQNLDPRHVMQPESLRLNQAETATRLSASPLAGIDHSASRFEVFPAERRRRLSCC